jgi:hypothetical protein
MNKTGEEQAIVIELKNKNEASEENISKVNGSWNFHNVIKKPPHISTNGRWCFGLQSCFTMMLTSPALFIVIMC